MKRLLYCSIAFICVLYFGCEEEELIDWDSIVPGHYYGELRYWSEADSIGEWMAGSCSLNEPCTLYEWGVDTIFLAHFAISKASTGFAVEFKDNRIVEMPVLDLYYICESDNDQMNASIWQSADLGSLICSTSLRQTHDNVVLRFSFRGYPETDSLYQVSFYGSKNPY